MQEHETLFETGEIDSPEANVIEMNSERTLPQRVDKAECVITDIIITDNTVEQAIDFGVKLRKLFDMVAAEEKAKTDHLKKELDQVKAPYLKMRKKIEALQAMLKQKLSQYQYELDKKRRAAEELAKKKALDELKKTQEKYEKKGDVESAIAIQGAMDHVAKTETTGLKSIAGTTSSASFRDNWVFTVNDIHSVPIEYTKVVIDELKIIAAISAGVRDIAGLTIENKPIPVLRDKTRGMR